MVTPAAASPQPLGGRDFLPGDRRTNYERTEYKQNDQTDGQSAHRYNQQPNQPAWPTRRSAPWLMWFKISNFKGIHAEQYVIANNHTQPTTRISAAGMLPTTQSSQTSATGSFRTACDVSARMEEPSGQSTMRIAPSAPAVIHGKINEPCCLAPAGF